MFSHVYLSYSMLVFQYQESNIGKIYFLLFHLKYFCINFFCKNNEYQSFNPTIFEICLLMKTTTINIHIRNL